MIKLTDFDDWTDWTYLDENPVFANQLVTTLNQVVGFSSNALLFLAYSYIWTYDAWFSPHHNEIKQDIFMIGNDQIHIRSTNREDLLNVHYYQYLNDLANNHRVNKGWIWNYFAHDQVLQVRVRYNLSLNIKLTKPIDQYHQNQLNAMGKLITDVCHLIFKNDDLDWKQFDEQWKQEFNQNWDVGIVFDLKDFANPKILMRWEDENGDNQYKNDYLKQVLNDNSPLLKFLN